MNRHFDGGFFAGGFFGTDGGRGSGHRWTQEEIDQYVEGMTPRKKKEKEYDYGTYLDRTWK